MRRSVLIALSIALPPAALEAQQAKPEDEIKQMESRRVQAMTSGDFASLEAVLADDATYVHSNGQLDGKEQYITDLKSGLVRYRSIENEDVKVRVYGDSAVVTGRSLIRAERNGQAGSSAGLQTLFTSVYIRRDGRWQMVALQSTQVPR